MIKITREKIIAVMPLALFGLLVLILAVGVLRGGNEGSKFARHVGEAAPVTDLSLAGTSQARFVSSAWRGRPYLLNFTASWCATCKSEHEELMTLAASGMPIVAVMFKDRSDRMTAYLAKEGSPYVAVAADEDGRAAIDWGVTGVPETYLVDAYGVIRWHHFGAITDDIAKDELMPLWLVVKRGD